MEECDAKDVNMMIVRFVIVIVIIIINIHHHHQHHHHACWKTVWPSANPLLLAISLLLATGNAC
jgi:hypothetical protein